jgi:Uma2 family endonuclease
MTVQVLERPLTAAPAEALSVEIVRRKFSVVDYHQMIDAGILSEDDRVELTDGEIRQMSAVDAIHASTVKRLSRTINDRVGKELIIGVQDPIQLGDYNEPEPDLSVLRWRDDFYEQQHPTVDDVLLVIEVAHTTLAYDRKEKLPRYAAAGVAEFWLIDIVHRVVEQYAQPVNGRYAVQRILPRGALVQATSIPELSLPVDRIFGLVS